jgi:Tfp pilus assembly protein PilF
MLSQVLAYKLLRLALVLVWVIGLAGLGAWLVNAHASNPYRAPQLTADQQKTWDFELAAARWYRDNHRPQLAAEHFRKALSIDPDNPGVKAELATVDSNSSSTK